MKRRNEDNVILLLKFVILLAFELPISVVDEDQDSRSSVAQGQPDRVTLYSHAMRWNVHVAFQNEQFLPLILHVVLHQMTQEVADSWPAAVIKVRR